MKITTILAAAALCLGLAACKRDLSTDEKAKADYGGLQFTNAAGGKFISCSGRDSDGDGYVTCQANMPTVGNDGHRRLELTEILCAYQGGSGCKLKR